MRQKGVTIQMVRQQTVKIRETRNKWVATNLHFGTVRRYKTLKGAIKAVKNQDAKDAENGVTSITKIEVDTTTAAGKAIAEVLLD